jgi:ABC-type nitrate/sulfonate/bicarbonate transport system substrate-binding protein
MATDALQSKSHWTRYLVGCLVLIGSVILAPSTVAAPTPIRFVFDWPVPDFSLVPVVVGQKMGFYEKNGVSVQMLFPPDAQTTARMLATSQADIGFEPTTDIVFAVNQGLPLLAIANFTQRNSWCLIGRPGEPIDLGHLRGKSIGVFADSWSKAMMSFVLKKANLHEHDVRMIIAQEDTLPLLLARRIDIATNAAAMGIAKVADTTKTRPTLACNDAIGVPNVPVWVFTATPAWLGAHGEAGRAWLKGTAEAITWSLQHPDEAAALFTKAYPAAGSMTYNTTGWTYTAGLMSGPNGYFRQDDAQWNALADALRSSGQIAQRKPASAYYTNAYLPK